MLRKPGLLKHYYKSDFRRSRIPLARPQSTTRESRKAPDPIKRSRESTPQRDARGLPADDSLPVRRRRDKQAALPLGKVTHLPARPAARGLGSDTPRAHRHVKDTALPRRGGLAPALAAAEPGPRASARRPAPRLAASLAPAAPPTPAAAAAVRPASEAEPVQGEVAALPEGRPRAALGQRARGHPRGGRVGAERLFGSVAAVSPEVAPLRRVPRAGETPRRLLGRARRRRGAAAGPAAPGRVGRPAPRVRQQPGAAAAAAAPAPALAVVVVVADLPVLELPFLLGREAAGGRGRSLRGRHPGAAPSTQPQPPSGSLLLGARLP